MLKFTDLGTAEKQYNKKLFDLCKKEKNFTVTETTSTTEIIYYNDKGEKKRKFYRFNLADPEDKLKVDYNPNIIPVLCKRVLGDVRKYLAAGNPMPEFNRDHFVTREHHPTLLSKIDVGDIIHEIDINRFYWTYAYNKGFISADTFKKYMKYKEARLIALGNLAKNTVIKKYYEGVLMEGLTTRVTSEYAPFFYNIICHGYEIYCQVMRAIDYKVFYFQTDAFWVQPSMHVEKKVREVLDAHKLQYKVTRYKVKEKGPNGIVITNLATKKNKTVKFFRN